MKAFSILITSFLFFTQLSAQYVHYRDKSNDPKPENSAARATAKPVASRPDRAWKKESGEGYLRHIEQKTGVYDRSLITIDSPYHFIEYDTDSLKHSLPVYGGKVKIDIVAKLKDKFQSDIYDIKAYCPPNNPKLFLIRSKDPSFDSVSGEIGRWIVNEDGDRISTDSANSICRPKITPVNEVKFPLYGALFFYDKAALTDSAKLKIDETLTGIEKSYEDYFLEVRGYTDSKGSFGYNDELSQRRANAVRNYILSKPGFKDNPLLIFAKGLGKRNLKNPYDGTDAVNRRVEIVVLGNKRKSI